MFPRLSAYLHERPSWVYFGLPALTVVLGMQALRTLVPLLTWVLRERLGWEIVLVGALGLAIFATGFVAASLRRLVGTRTMLVATAGGLGILRLAMQVWTGDPLGDLYFAIGAVVLFFLFLPVYFSYVRGKEEAGTGNFALGMLLGLALDVTLHGAFVTYDLSWDGGVAGLMVIAVLAGLLWAFLAILLALAKNAGEDLDVREGSWGSVLPWLALGPFLFLQMLLFQNLARLVALTEWTYPYAFAWMAFSHVAGMGAALWTLNHGQRPLWPFAVLVGGVLIAATAVPSGGGTLDAALLLVGQVSCAVLLVVILGGTGRSAANPGLARTTVAHGLGMVLLVALLFGFYVVYEMDVPYSNALLPPLAGLILGIGALVSTRLLPPGRPSARVNWLPLQVSLLLVVVPLVWALTWETPETTAGEGYPVRVMTYNLHNGFDTDGYLGMEAQARVIEAVAQAQRPDVVALQEVSRGWVVNGSLDMLTWLSQRLELPYVYGPTAGPLWGNALLSRYPMMEWGEVELPPRDLLILRSFLWARLDVGDGQELMVINTHYHNPEEDTDIRVTQTQAILDFWDGQKRTVFLGDLNTRPGEAPLEMLRKAGLADAWDLAGIGSGNTAPPEKPRNRIDYIWVSGDLGVSDVTNPRSLASDHLPVVATIIAP